MSAGHGPPRLNGTPHTPETLGTPPQPIAHVQLPHQVIPWPSEWGRRPYLSYGPQETLTPLPAQILWDLPPSSTHRRETETRCRSPFPQGHGRVCRGKVCNLDLRYLALYAARHLGPSGREQYRAGGCQVGSDSNKSGSSGASLSGRVVVCRFARLLASGSLPTCCSLLGGLGS